MVWAGILSDRIIYHFLLMFLFVFANKYLIMLQEEIFPSLLYEDGNLSKFYWDSLSGGIYPKDSLENLQTLMMFGQRRHTCLR